MRLIIQRQKFTPVGIALFAYYIPYGKLKDIIYCRHNLMHIVIGFSDFLLEIFAGIACNREHSSLKQFSATCLSHSRVPTRCSAV